MRAASGSGAQHLDCPIEVALAKEFQEWLGHGQAVPLMPIKRGGRGRRRVPLGAEPWTWRTQTSRHRQRTPNEGLPGRGSAGCMRRVHLARRCAQNRDVPPSATCTSRDAPSGRLTRGRSTHQPWGEWCDSLPLETFTRVLDPGRRGTVKAPTASQITGISLVPDERLQARRVPGGSGSRGFRPRAAWLYA